MLARIVNMRGVDLDTFDFDFDLTWAAFFMNPDGHVYGRYGSREEGHAEAGLSLKGLKYAMAQSLKSYRAKPDAKPAKDIGSRAGLYAKPELYPAAKRMKKDRCIHCHEVHNFQQDLFWSKKSWSKDRMWRYPPPKTIGLHLEVDQGDKVKSVIAGSAAANAGLKGGDVLTKLNGYPVSSPADAQYALNRAPKAGSISVAWTRDGKEMSSTVKLTKGWRKSDISWRASMWTMPPAMGIYGRNLTVAQKKKLGLGPKRLAFYQGRYVPPKTRRAGFRANDVVIGIDGRKLEMTMLEFNAMIREKYNVGDKVVFNVIRRGKRVDIPMTLPKDAR